MRTLLIIVAIAASVAGCMVGPDYKRPDVEMPQSFRYDNGQASDIADGTWWKQFNDPVLDQLIAEALGNNKSVQIATANVERASGILTSTRSALFPQINYSGNWARQRLSDNNVTRSPAPNPYNNFQVLGGASWEIDLWGRIRRLTEAAQASLLATVEARRGVILSLTAEIAASYIQLRALDEQLVIARNTKKTYSESVKLFELQNKYGQVSGMTVEQARSQYETAAAQIPQIETQIAQTENALSILLGRNPTPIPRGRRLNELTPPVVPSSLPSTLLERRPDILQAEQNLIAANAQIGAARALYFPSISLTGAAGGSSEDLSNLFLGPSRTWNFIGSVTGPIFTAGSIRGQVRQAEASRQAALRAYEQTIQAAFADMENSLVSRQKLGEQLVAEERRVAAYKEYARFADLQYNGGYTPYLTVLNAQQQLFPAELNAVQTKAASLVSIVNIYKAMGGGWVTEADNLTKAGPAAK
ncbi:MAG: efflux transporter outer membrane subunit [Syntrophorhabdaceae bacterium]|nr:efflux transporter outer membrane subunit [Syntrophorhabdaceae bacterium]